MYIHTYTKARDTFQQEAILLLLLLLLQDEFQFQARSFNFLIQSPLFSHTWGKKKSKC